MKVSTMVGDVALIGNETVLTQIVIGAAARAVQLAAARPSHPVLHAVRKQLDEYFRSERSEFCLPLAGGGTPFQRDVWHALGSIPFGEVRSYAWLARTIGRPRAVRAVGNANGRNRFPIVIPCHRVIASNGEIGGYTGGVEIKRKLLAHESPRG